MVNNMKQNRFDDVFRYRLLLEHSNEIIIFFDQTGKITQCNQAAKKELGFGEDIFLVSIAAIFRKALIFEDQKLEIMNKYKNHIAETVAYRKNQTCFAVDLKISIVHTKSDYTGICTATNVNEKKDAIRDLKNAENETVAACKIKNEFLANITHELRTPVNGIMGLTENLLDSELSLGQTETLNIIHRCCSNMTTIINDLLDFSKIEAGKLVLEQREFDFRKFIENTVALNINSINEKGLKLIVNIANDIPNRVIGDELRLAQIINNLFSNAVKFTFVGQIAMEILKTDQTDTDLELFFMVFDTGIGISGEEMEKLFKSFSQVDGSITRRFGGTGLGLAICKELVELMYGSINVSSEKDKGSTFYFSVHLGIGEGETEDCNNWNFEKCDPTEQNNLTLNSMEISYQADLIKQFGTEENLRELRTIIERLMICIEMGIWERAEYLADLIKKLITNADSAIKRKAFRLELSVRKENHENSLSLLLEIQRMIDEVV